MLSGKIRLFKKVYTLIYLKYKAKNVSILLYLLILSLFQFQLFAQSTDKELYELRGNIRLMKEHTYKASVENGKLTKAWSLHYPYKTIFNSEGNIVKRTLFDKSGFVIEKEYAEFDEQNRKISKTIEEHENIIKYLYFYNNFNLLQKVQLFENKVFVSKTEFVYDTLNRLAKEYTYTDNTTELLQFQYKKPNIYVFYSDSNVTNRLVREEFFEDYKQKQVYYNSDNTWYSLSSTYNAKGFPEEIVIWHSQGTKSIKKYEYAYDRQGNWKKRIEYENGVPVFVYERKLRYRWGR